MLIHVEAHLVGKDDDAVFTLVDDGFDLIAKLLEFASDISPSKTEF